MIQNVLLDSYNLVIIGIIYMMIGYYSGDLLSTYVMRPYEKDKSKTHNFMRLIYEFSVLMIASHYIQYFIHKQVLKHITSNLAVGYTGNVFVMFVMMHHVSDDLQSKMEGVLN